MGAIFQVFVVVGIVYAYVFGSFVKYVTFNILCGVWPVIHAIGVFTIPESPYFLLSKNRDGEAKMARARLRDESDADTAKELCNLKVLNVLCYVNILLVFIMHWFVCHIIVEVSQLAICDTLPSHA